MLITNLYMMISFKTLIVTRISFSYFCDDRQGCKETSLRQHFCQMFSGATCILSPVPEVPGSSSETLQQSKLTFSKSHLLVTFSWKVGTMKKKFRQKKKKEKHNIQGRTHLNYTKVPFAKRHVSNTFLGQIVMFTPLPIKGL